MITKFILKGLHCEACGKVSQLKIKKIEGVVSVQIHQHGQEAEGELESDREINLEEIQGVLSDTAYTVHTA